MRGTSILTENSSYVCFNMKSATLIEQGGVFEVRVINEATMQPRAGGGVRGCVTSFSKASRKRLIDLTSRLDVKGHRVVFMTLTFSSNPELSEARRAFKMFTMRIRRKNPQMSAIWRLERQKRGAIHYHLIMFDFPFTPQAGLQSSWEECTGEETSILDIRLVRRGRKSVMYYVSKYVAKHGDGDGDGVSGSTSLVKGTYQHEVESGRHWGYINREKLPFADRFEYHVEGGDAVRYALWGITATSKGRSGKSNVHAKLYCSNKEVKEMMRFALSICELQGEAVVRRRGERLSWRNDERLAAAHDVNVLVAWDRRRMEERERWVCVVKGQRIKRKYYCRKSSR